MGRQAKVKAVRREERKVLAELERAGIAEKVRNVYLALRREDVQSAIKTACNESAPWTDRQPMDSVAGAILRQFGYDLEGLSITAHMKPGRRFVDGLELKQEPPTVVFTADVSEEALSAACAAAGVKIKGSSLHAPAYN